jgi:hypothetical protein
VTVGDAASSEVVRGELQRNPVTVHDLDSIAPESPGHGRQDGLAGVQLNRKHPSLELLNDFSQYFNRVFFGQIVLFPSV